MILLDTTVLSYAVGMEHPLRAPARSLLKAHREGRLAATTTVEVLQEFLHVRSRRHGRDEAAGLTLKFADAFDLISTSPTDLRAAALLFVRYEGLGAFDSVLAAVAIERRADALVSADRAFADVEGLRWIDLAAPDLGEELRPGSGPTTPLPPGFRGGRRQPPGPAPHG